MVLKRTLLKLIGNEFLEVPSMISSLTIGDTFKMVEPDGTPVTWDGKDSWVCLDLPYVDEYGVEGVRAE